MHPKLRHGNINFLWLLAYYFDVETAHRSPVTDVEKGELTFKTFTRLMRWKDNPARRHRVLIRFYSSPFRIIMS